MTLRSNNRNTRKANSARKFDVSYLHDNIKKNYKKRFKKKITSTQINKIWRDWIEETISKPLSNGTIVKIDKNSRFWVMATKTTEHKRAMSLLEKGLVYKGGVVAKAELNHNTFGYIYKVVYENDLFKGDTKLFFKPHSDITKNVRDGINKGKLITRLSCQ